MNIYFEDEECISPELLETMKKAAAAALGSENVPAGAAELSVSFVSPDRIRELNAAYRGIDRVTDVLSFPLAEGPEELRESAEKFGVCELGDVVICRERAEEQAAEFGHSFERELIYLFVHSVFHLLGYDHEREEDRRAMRAREEAVMTLLGIPRA